MWIRDRSVHKQQLFEVLISKGGGWLCSMHCVIVFPFSPSLNLRCLTSCMGPGGRCARALNVSPNCMLLRRLHACLVKFTLEKKTLKIQQNRHWSLTTALLGWLIPALEIFDGLIRFVPHLPSCFSSISLTAVLTFGSP